MSPSKRILELAAAAGVDPFTVRWRLSKGQPLEHALRPVGSTTHPLTGKPVKLCDLAAEIGISRQALYTRMRRGDTGAELMRPRSGTGGRPPSGGIEACAAVLERWAVSHYGADAPHLRHVAPTSQARPSAPPTSSVDGGGRGIPGGHRVTEDETSTERAEESAA